MTTPLPTAAPVVPSKRPETHHTRASFCKAGACVDAPTVAVCRRYHPAGARRNARRPKRHPNRPFNRLCRRRRDPRPRNRIRIGRGSVVGPWTDLRRYTTVPPTYANVPMKRPAVYPSPSLQSTHTASFLFALGARFIPKSRTRVGRVIAFL